MRPVGEGMIRFESLVDAASGITIEHVQMANDYLDTKSENELRARAASEKK